jgi:ankyrin repeat protein
MKFNVFTLSLGIALLSVSLLPAGNFTRSNRQNALIQPFFTAIKAGDLNAFNRYAKMRRITNFDHLTDAKYGMNPLHWAAVTGNVAFIKYLIMHGANVNAKTPKGFTPLHLAVFAGQTQAAKCLVLEGNCQINIPNHSGLTPIKLACIEKNVELVRFLTHHLKAKVARFAIKYPRNIVAKIK